MPSDKTPDAALAALEDEIKSIQAKVVAMQAALARARDAFAVKPPSDASADEVKAYDERCKKAVKLFGYNDRYLATAKGRFDEMRKIVKKR